MILAAYSRGLASVETPFIKGSMAAVGLGYSQVLNFNFRYNKVLKPKRLLFANSENDDILSR